MLPIRHENDVPRSSPYLESLQQLAWVGVDNRQGAFIFRSRINKLSVRSNSYAFRLIARADGLSYFSLCYIDKANTRCIFIGYIDGLAVLTDREVFRIGTGLHHSHEFVRCDIENANAVRAFIGRRKITFVHSWAFWGRAAQRDINSFPIGTGVNPSRAFTQMDRSYDRKSSRVNNGQVARDLVGNVNAIGRRRAQTSNWSGRTWGRCACCRRCRL